MNSFLSKYKITIFFLAAFSVISPSVEGGIDDQLNGKQWKHHSTHAKSFTSSSPEEIIAEELQTITNPSLHELAILASLEALDSTDHYLALNQLSGVQYTNLFPLSEIGVRRFIRRMYDPLRKIIRTTPSESCDCPHQFLTGGWCEGGFDQTCLHSRSCFDGFKSSGYDLSAGLQTSPTPGLTIGVAGSYENDTIDYPLSDKGTNNTYLAGIYSLYRPCDYYVLADLVLGYSKNYLHRHIEIDTHHFDPKTNVQFYQGALYIEAGKDLPFYGCLNTYLFQPFIGLEVGYCRNKKSREHSNDSLFNLSINGKSDIPFSGRLGIHFASEFFSKLTFGVDAAWQHRFNTFSHHAKGHFQNFGDDFSIEGAYLSHDSFDGAVNLTFHLGSNLRFYLEGAGQIWSHASSYNAFAGIQAGW